MKKKEGIGKGEKKMGERKIGKLKRLIDAGVIDKEAYDKACSLNPEISKVRDKRTSDAALLNGKQTLAQKREAASSIMGTQGGAPARSEDMSMRDALTEAYDAQTG